MAAHQPPDVPAPLWRAIVKAGNKYDVPPSILASIWRGESGSTYPNPYKNSLGYGGLFGTKLWNGSTQAQANYAASIFHNALVTTHGNILEANGIYATGKPTPGVYGHAGIPTGTVPGYGGKGGFSVVNVATDVGSAVVNPVGTAAGAVVGGIGGIAHDIASPVESVVGGFKSITDAISFVFSINGLEVIGGGIMMLMGLYLLAKQVGLADGIAGAALTAAAPEAAVAANAAGAAAPKPVKNVYYLDTPPSQHAKRRAAESTYDPATSEIPF